jgi:hypothetical protein
MPFQVGSALSVSVSAGPARQYYVQVQGPHETCWRRMGTFRQRQQAEDHERKLSRRGLRTRIVHCAITPAAG